MKQFTLALLVLFALCVSACGGGGSGDSAQIIKDHDSIFTAIPTGNGTSIGGGDLTKTADGLRLDAAHVFGFGPSTARTVDFPSGENSVYRDHGTEIRASGDSKFTLTGDFGELGNIRGDFTGDVLITDTLRLGGMKAGLKYSEFGMWQINVAFKGTVDGTPANLNVPFLPTSFLLGDSAMARSFTANSGEQRFSGLALAHAWDSSDLGNLLTADLHGTATLTVDTANLATGGSLELSFADFYNFQVSGLDVTSDSFARYGTTPVITPNGTNTTGIVLSPNELDGSAGGFFHGATTPEEAVGDFYFDNANKGIVGAFGVVQQP